MERGQKEVRERSEKGRRKGGGDAEKGTKKSGEGAEKGPRKVYSGQSEPNDHSHELRSLQRRSITPQLEEERLLRQGGEGAKKERRQDRK